MPESVTDSSPATTESDEVATTDATVFRCCVPCCSAVGLSCRPCTSPFHRLAIDATDETYKGNHFCGFHGFPPLQWCVCCVVHNSGEFYEEEMDNLVKRWYRDSELKSRWNGFAEVTGLQATENNMMWRQLMLECQRLLCGFLADAGFDMDSPLMREEQVLDFLRNTTENELRCRRVTRYEFSDYVEGGIYRIASSKDCKKVRRALAAAKKIVLKEYASSGSASSCAAAA